MPDTHHPRCAGSADLGHGADRAPEGREAALTFEMKATDAITPDGTALGKLVSQVYDEGRSQFGHGGRAALIQDLPVRIETVDHLASAALERYVLCLRSYVGNQDYDSFLAAIPSCLPKPVAPITGDSTA